MRPDEENIDALSRAILKEAQVDASQLESEAREKAEEIRKHTQEQAAAERGEILERAKQEAERIKSQTMAGAQLKARTLQLEHREKLLDRVFKTAREKLPGIQQRADYEKVAVQLLKEALIQLKASKAEVRADAGTQKVLKQSVLDQISKELNVQLTLGKPLEHGTGVVVDASDGRLHYDNTLETRLDRMQNAMRSSVYQVLMGEKL
ncbi:MAG TPA: V-type ATP synthase subunit E family protein [Anaerolineales bacterium]|nr:V-type ATP synthase subunit E family protein [Anaerolineales bacterium]